MTSSQNLRNTLWTNSEILTLIEIWKQNDVQIQLHGCVRNSRIFEVISEKMLEYGFEKSGCQCREKLKKLKAEWRKIRDHNSHPGNSRKQWRFFDTLGQIMHREISTGSQLSVVYQCEDGTEITVPEQSDVVCQNETDLALEVVTAAAMEEACLTASEHDYDASPPDECGGEPASPLPGDRGDAPVAEEPRRRRGRPPSSTTQPNAANLMPQLMDCFKACVKELLNHEARKQEREIACQERREERDRLAQELREERERLAAERREERDRQHDLKMIEMFSRSQEQLVQLLVGKFSGELVGHMVEETVIATSEEQQIE